MLVAEIDGSETKARGAGGVSVDQQKRITANALFAMLEKQAYRCTLTGRSLTPGTASLDHATPLSKGGANTIDNVEIVHADINQAKGAMTRDEFIQMCREVMAWADGKNC